MIKMDFNWADHYYWFYSALAQSLAAFLGIIGVFAIFRLQIQHHFVEDAFSKLRDFVLKKDLRGNSLKIISMSDEDLLFKHCTDLNNFWAKKCMEHEKKVRALEEEITPASSGMTKVAINSNIGHLNDTILRDRELIAGLMLLKTKCMHGHTEKEIISGRAFYITKHLCILFALSMLGLYFVNDLVFFPSLSNISRFAAFAMLMYLFSIGIELIKFFKRCLKGDFLADAFKDVEKKK